MAPKDMSKGTQNYMKPSPLKDKQIANSKPKRAGIVTFLFSESAFSNLANFIAILEPLVSYICVITGDIFVDKLKSPKIKVVPISHHEARPFVSRVLRYLFTQFKTAFQLTKNLNDIDLLFFYIGGSSLVLPMLCAKLGRKKVAIVATGNPVEIAGVFHHGLLDKKIINTLERINYKLCDLIVTFSGGLKQYPELTHYRKKLYTGGALFVDTSLFRVEKPLSQRQQIVAYIGRLSKEKGVLEFVQAIKLLSGQDTIHFLIIGDGPAREQISHQLAKEQEAGKVKLLAWLPPHKVAIWLNEAKLLLIPSYTEGLPTILLETMSCGTPVLATPVGSIPQLIKDEKTGFILEDNSPESIARGIIRALNHAKLEQIARNALQIIKEEYTYEAAVERYRTILSSLSLR